MAFVRKDALRYAQTLGLAKYMNIRGLPNLITP